MSMHCTRTVSICIAMYVVRGVAGLQQLSKAESQLEEAAGSGE